MANNYLQFSEAIADLTTPEEKWCERVLALNIKDATDQQTLLQEFSEEVDIIEEFDGVWPGFDTNLHTDNVLHIYAEEFGHLDQLAIFVSAFIRKFRPDYIFRCTYASTCSKMHLGEFGGGWIAVSHEGTRWGSAYAEAEKAEYDILSGRNQA